ncbi:MAG TPA: FG-GAP-like repeat-containing protein, partial [Bacteroidota bacterium]
VPELLLSRETARQVKPFSRVEIASCLHGQWRTLWEEEGLRFAGRDLRPEGRISEFRPALFGHNETWMDTASADPRAFLFRDPRLAGHPGSSFVELAWENSSFCTRSVELPDAPGALMSGLADLDGDGRNERILSDARGAVHILSAEGSVTTSFQTGFRLPLEGYYIARPAQVPVVFREGPGDSPRIALIDNANTLHLLQEQRDSSVRELWQHPARGCVGYDLAFHAAYVTDIDVDGVSELLVTDPRPDRTSRLVALGPDGEEKGAWEVPGAPPILPLRIGTYMWQVLPIRGENRIIAASFASYSMNSEGSVCFGLDGHPFWRLTEYGEGEWGRGMGPWSAYSSMMGTDGTPRLFFLAKDLVCEVDAADGSWRREPWLLWHATTVAMGQPDWDFSKDRLPLFGTDKDPFTAYGSPILIDVDGDGREEIVIGGCFGGMGVLREDHSVLWWKRTPFTDVTLRLPGIADLSGTGRRSVGACHADGSFVCYDGATGRERWTLRLETTTSDIVSCDIDGDGREEFIMGTTDGRLLAIGEDAGGRGVLRWSVEIGTSVGTPAIADTDGDGSPEIIAVAGDGKVYCVGRSAPIA